MNTLRIGQGFDVHSWGQHRPLVLGGVHIPYVRGLLGHSDADVLTHAVCDAVLGAAGLRDIGFHFPDTDPKYEGISSLRLLEHVVDLAAGAGVRAMIQPGGSVRDDESVAAADEHGLAMVFTGTRHFRH